MPETFAFRAIIEREEISGQGCLQFGPDAVGIRLGRQVLGGALDDSQQCVPGLGGIFGLEQIELTVGSIVPKFSYVGFGHFRRNFQVPPAAFFLKNKRGQEHERHIAIVDGIKRLFTQEAHGLELVG